MNGFVYVLGREYAEKLDEKGRDLVERIRSSGRRMMQLIDDLLNLSRVTTSAIHDDIVDLSATVRSIAENLRKNEPRRKIEFMIASDLRSGVEQLGDMIAGASTVLPFTGAGISTECGIPDFRSPGGLWTRNRPIPFAAETANG